MTTHKLRLLVDALFRKTMDGSLRWDESPEENTFQAVFPDQTVSITSSREGANLVIYDDNARVITSCSSSDMFQFDINAANALTQLFKMARDNALGVDVKLDKLLNDLSQR